jgi:hypothetical protein
MMRRLVFAAALISLATTSPAQVCRGFASFDAHRARVGLSYSNQPNVRVYGVSAAYGSNDGGFGTIEYLRGATASSTTGDFSSDGAEATMGVEITHERLGPVAICPLGGLGIENAHGSSSFSSSSVHTRTYFLGVAGGFTAALTNTIRLVPSIEVVFRSDEENGSAIFNGSSSTFSGVRSEYVLTTVSAGVAFNEFTFAPVYQRRFGKRPTWWGFRASWAFGSPF